MIDVTISFFFICNTVDSKKSHRHVLQPLHSAHISTKQDFLNVEHNLSEKIHHIVENQQSVFLHPVSSVEHTLHTLNLDALEDSRKLVVGIHVDTSSFPSPIVSLGGQKYTHKITTGFRTKDIKGLFSFARVCSIVS